MNAALLASGAPIGQINILRKHLSAVKGGQLAAAAFPARMLALMISDVPGDDPAFIGSGPTVGDGSAPERRPRGFWRAGISPRRLRCMPCWRAGGVIAPDDAQLQRVENQVIAAPAQSLAAAADLARAAGCAVQIAQRCAGRRGPA
ncbi:MAG: DUF4147 domain-containing protein [Paracoccaceae bacterium]